VYHFTRLLSYYREKNDSRTNAEKLKACTERRNWTEVNWHGLVSDEMANEQAVMH